MAGAGGRAAPTRPAELEGAGLAARTEALSALDAERAGRLTGPLRELPPGTPKLQA
ncbi:hypothetical protein [Streptomyces triticisoli]|uniref:hypothetical protein n=1 Tax=Streptomyces triticisoli TaxID=2182797 RepID=UPI0022B7FD76|nr:hypothetical protein [Streptomyces triticisoli]